MKENTLQPNQEKNLALERQEAVKLHNDILEKYNSLPEEDRKTWDYEKNQPHEQSEQAKDNVAKMSELREKVGNIDTYREIAKPFNDQYYYRVGDTSTIEKLQTEKEKVDAEIERVKVSIQKDTDTLNELRSKLGMEPTTDIPSLDVQKERLPYLLEIQNDIKNKLDFEIKKQESQKEEDSENSKKENRNMDMGLEEIFSGIKKISSLLDERRSNGYNTIFNDEDAFRAVANKIGESLNNEEIKNNLIRLGSIVEEFSDNRGRGVNDDTENLYNMVSKLRQLTTALQELPQKLQNEEERKDLSQVANMVAEKVDSAASRITRKAQAIEEFLR